MSEQLKTTVLGFLVASMGLVFCGCTSTKPGELKYYDEPLEPEPEQVNYSPIKVRDVTISTTDFTPEKAPKLQVDIWLEEECYKLQKYEKYSAYEMTKKRYPLLTAVSLKYYWSVSDEFSALVIWTPMCLFVSPIMDGMIYPIYYFTDSFEEQGAYYNSHVETTSFNGPKIDTETYTKKVIIDRGHKYDLSHKIFVTINGYRREMESNILSLEYSAGWSEFLKGKGALPLMFSFEDQLRQLDLSKAFASQQKHLEMKRSFEVNLLEKRLAEHRDQQ